VSNNPADGDDPCDEQPLAAGLDDVDPWGEFGNNPRHWVELKHITPDAVERAMIGFPLVLAEDWDYPRLALTIRWALASHDQSAEPFNKVSKPIGATLRALDPLTDQIWLTLAVRSADPENLLEHDEASFRRFKRLLDDLAWVRGWDVLKEVTAPFDRQVRVSRAHHLAVVFKGAFGCEPTADKPHSRTNFMDFYARMVKLAFGAAGKVESGITEICEDGLSLYRGGTPRRIGPKKSRSKSSD
jgi:hypothetical protein